jgi:hypothetical protein
VLIPSRTNLSDYYMEEMGNIAMDFYILSNHRPIQTGPPYVLADYQQMLPLP